MKKKRWCFSVALFVIVFLGCLSGWSSAFEGVHRGRIIDAETRQPIQGVVILGIWNRAIATPGGAVHEFYDARETLTDERGEFSIAGMGFPGAMGLDPMDVLIFKAGYSHIGPGPWERFRDDDAFGGTIRWEGDRVIIPLKRLSMEERRRRTPSFEINQADPDALRSAPQLPPAPNRRRRGLHTG